MKHAVDLLSHRKVIDANGVHDHLQIWFDDDIRLNVYNRHCFLQPQMNAPKITVLNGATVEQVFLRVMTRF